MKAVVNGKVLTMAGKNYENGMVIIDGGKIKEVGENLTLPENCEIIDAKGGIITPGIIDAHCHLGMWEEAIGFEGSDGNEMTDPITPNLRAIDAINPLDISFKEARDGGVTTAVTGPGSANCMGGTFVAIKTVGKRVDDMVFKNPLAMKIAFGENPKRVYNAQKKAPMTRMAIAGLLRETLAKAKEYAEKKGRDDSLKFDAKMEALMPVMSGDIHLKAHAHRADDIFTAIRIAKEFGLKLTLEHCTEGHLIADELAKEGYPAIVGPSFGSRTKFELKEKSFKTAGVLAKAGVKIAIMTDHPVIPLQSLPMCAGLAVKDGLDEDEAWKAITVNPAEITGISDRVGTLEAGKDADIAVFDKNPLKNLDYKVLYTIIDGNVVHSL